MSTEQGATKRRNIPILAGQGAFSIMAWSMASPAVVLTFLAVSLDLPIILAGVLVAIRHTAGTIADMFLSNTVSRTVRKKGAIALTDLAVAACFALVVVVVVYGSRPMMIAAFVAAIFLIGIIEEFKSLMITDFISDNLQSASRMRVHYIQMALGGAGTIGLALLAHEVMKGTPPHFRHSMVVAIGVACFIVSALSMMALSETSAMANPARKRSPSPAKRLAGFFADARGMFALSWFRKYMALRLSFVLVGLSVPFFALIAAEVHHTSARGLTALVVSSAAGMMVAAPLWRALNGYSNRAVMLAGTLMIAISGIALITIHLAGWNHDVRLHAVSLFVATVAVTGLSGARSLHFMDVAPKDQRVAALATSKSIARLAMIAFSAMAATIAHTQDIVWAVVAITIVSLIAAIVSFFFVDPPAQSTGASV